MSPARTSRTTTPASSTCRWCARRWRSPARRSTRCAMEAGLVVAAGNPKPPPHRRSRAANGDLRESRARVWQPRAPRQADDAIRQDLRRDARPLAASRSIRTRISCRPQLRHRTDPGGELRSERNGPWRGSYGIRVAALKRRDPIWDRGIPLAASVDIRRGQLRMIRILRQQRFGTPFSGGLWSLQSSLSFMRQRCAGRDTRRDGCRASVRSGSAGPAGDRLSRTCTDSASRPTRGRAVSRGPRIDTQAPKCPERRPRR